MTFAHADKVRARKALNHAVAAGTVVPRPCGRCGAQKAQAHHEDYSKPLQVEWLCAKCHSVLHNQKHPLTKLCAVCGSEFTPHPTKRARAVTCSPDCRAARIAAAKRANPTRPSWTKLNREQALQIRARLARGESKAALAGEYRVHVNTVAAIETGRTWK